MSLIERNLLLRGSRGQRKVRALFDSGASFSFVRRDIAESVGRPEALPEPIGFERESVVYDKSLQRLRV